MAPRHRAPRQLADRVERHGREIIEERPLRIAIIEELRAAISFDWYAWLLTDPQTEVGASPLADVPSLHDLPRLIRAKYLTDINRWTTLDATAVTLHVSTGGVLEASRWWREALAAHAVTDVASLTLRDAFGCWGWLDLWRVEPSPPFDTAETSALAGLVPTITTALRCAQGHSFAGASHRVVPSGPAVLVLSAELDVTAQTPATEEYLRALVPPNGGEPPIPAGAYNVGAQLLALEAGIDDHPPSARVHLGGGAWLTLAAARTDSDRPPRRRDIAVSIERCPPAARRELFARCHALTPRERELVELLARGADTRATAQQMFVSEHTVQDHLKSIFAKTGTRNRRTLLTRMSGE